MSSVPHRRRFVRTAVTSDRQGRSGGGTWLAGASAAGDSSGEVEVAFQPIGAPISRVWDGYGFGRLDATEMQLMEA